MSYAPIALFAYNRPDHLLQTLTSLSECELADKSRLFIFCDGPKSERDEAAVRQVREVADRRRWCAEVEIVSQEKNQGLARSVIAGVTRLCNEFGRVIVLEDDMLLSRGLLVYLNRALVQYENEAQVLQVSGHVFPFMQEGGGEDAFFMPISTTQGWGTWKRAWDLFDPAATGWERLREERALRKRFDLDNSFPYAKMLEAQMTGKLDSWAIRWHWSFFKQQGLCLYPRTSLIFNIGFDDQGTHTTGNDFYYNDRNWKNDRYVNKIPDAVAPNRVEYARLKKYLKNKNSVISIIKIKISKMAKKLL